MRSLALRSVPGLGKQMQGVPVDEKALDCLCAGDRPRMTPEERNRRLIDARGGRHARRRRPVSSSTV